MANTTGKKFGGRQKGTPNALTRELRNVLKNIIYNELDSISEVLDQLEPKERIDVLIKLMPFVFPKMNAVSHTTDEPIDFLGWQDNI